MSNLNKEATNAFLNKLQQILTAPDQVTGHNNPLDNTYISFCSGGILLKQDALSFGELKSSEEKNANSFFSLLVNSIPQPSVAWQPTDEKIWDVYEKAIKNIILPAVELTADEKKLLKKAYDFLFKEVTKKDPFTDEETKEVVYTPEHKAYEAQKKNYQDALIDYNHHLIEATKNNRTDEDTQDWFHNGSIYKDRVMSAYTNWESEGNKGYVEKAQSIIANLGYRGQDAYYPQMRGDLEMSRKTDLRGFEYHPTFCFPDALLQQNIPWPKYNFTHSDSTTFSSSENTSWGASASVNYGLWNVGGDASHTTSEENLEWDVEGFDMSFELTQVPILRPWFKPWIFKSRGWNWDNSGIGLISDGNKPPKGIMPLIPTAMILMRNVRVKLDTNSGKNKRVIETTKASGSVGWGPISFGGNYANSSDRKDSHVEADHGEFIEEAPQIIGFICEQLPKSPDPDSNLNWPH